MHLWTNDFDMKNTEYTFERQKDKGGNTKGL